MSLDPELEEILDDVMVRLDKLAAKRRLGIAIYGGEVSCPRALDLLAGRCRNPNPSELSDLATINGGRPTLTVVR